MTRQSSSWVERAFRSALDDPARAQGTYYVATGIWPIVHLRSFELVTGPKPEGWLVKTVGALVAVVGVVLLRSSGKPPREETVLLGAGSAAVFATVDTWYSLRGRIRPVYLLEAIPELFLLAAWMRRH